MGVAKKQTKQTIICPRCRGNGYFRVKQDVYTHKDLVVQCPMCKSEGEIKHSLTVLELKELVKQSYHKL